MAHFFRMLLLSLLCRVSFAADALTVIERSLNEQYTSLQSIDVKFRLVHNVPKGEQITKEMLSATPQWEWVKSGAKLLIAREAQKTKAALPGKDRFYRVWRCFDGDKGIDVLPSGSVKPALHVKAPHLGPLAIAPIHNPHFDREKKIKRHSDELFGVGETWFTLLWRRRRLLTLIARPEFRSLTDSG